MSNATFYPSGLRYFQWATPTFPKPRLLAGISSTTTTITFTAPPLDSSGTVITGNFLMGIRNDEGYVETCFVPSGTLSYDAQSANFTAYDVVTGGTSGATAIVLSDSDSGTTGTLTLFEVSGTFQNNETITSNTGGSATVNGTLTNAVSSDGLTATGIVRGIELEGIDYTVGDSSNSVAFREDSAVFCNISATIQAMVVSAIQGSIATGGNNLRVGDGRAGNKTITADTDQTTNPTLVWDDSDGRWKITWGDDAPAGGTVDGVGVPVLTTAERDARTWPNSGVTIYNSTVGQTQFREAGNWVSNASAGTVADATLTSGGKVALLTAAEIAALTDTEPSSGSPGVMQPSTLAPTIQNQSWTFAADAAGSDSYAITLAQAPSSYTTGLRISFTVQVANTGPATVNVNSLGAVALVKGDSTPLVTGDLAAGQVVDAIYDGTNFVMLSLPNSLVADQNASPQHYHDLSTSDNPKVFISIADAANLDFGSPTRTDHGIIWQINTPATDNQGGGFELDTGGSKSFHADNPAFMIGIEFATATTQDGFIGFVRNTFSGTSMEDAAMTLHHFGYAIADGAIYGSCADGTTQQTTSALGTTLTDFNRLAATFDGTTVTFYVNGSSVGTLSSNVPSAVLNSFVVSVVADSSAGTKIYYLSKMGGIEFDRPTSIVT